ncbi:MAG: hypothetical protein HC927_00710 [Deltaproteobacteria bacterium]|nr:hypothetical protein [Deltaproteobacteria bacterium]
MLLCALEHLFGVHAASAELLERIEYHDDSGIFYPASGNRVELDAFLERLHVAVDLLLELGLTMPDRRSYLLLEGSVVAQLEDELRGTLSDLEARQVDLGLLQPCPYSLQNGFASRLGSALLELLEDRSLRLGDDRQQQVG